MSHSRLLYPEPLRHVQLLIRLIGTGLAVALLTLAIILTTRTGDTPPITYVAVIWSLLLNSFDWTCLLVRGRIPPGALLSLDLVAVGLLVAGTVNLAVVDFAGDGERRSTRGQGDLVTAERWVQGILLAVHTIMLGYSCLDCNTRYYREEEVARVRSSRGGGGRGSRRSSGRGSYRETETVRVSVRK